MKIKQRISSFFSDSLFRNASYLVANSIIGSLAGFVFWLVAARLYTAEDVGLASTIFSAIGLLALLSEMGLSMSLVRFIPSFKYKNRLINTCFTVSGVVVICLSSIFVIGVDIFSPALSFIRDNILYTIVFISYSLFVILAALQDSIFVAFRQTSLSFVKMCIQSILKIPIVVLLVALGSFGIITSFAIAHLFGILLSLWFLIPKISSKYIPYPTIDYSILKQITHFSMANFIARLFESLPTAILPLLVTNILNPEMTAYFFMAWMVATVAFIIPKSISTSLLAEGSHTIDKFETHVKKSLKIIFLIIIPLLIFMFLFGDEILLLFGKNYSGSGLNLLLTLLVSAIPLSFNTLFMTIKRIEKDMISVISINAAITIGTLSISYLTLESMGIIAIGVAWFTSQTFVLIICTNKWYKLLTAQ